MTVDPGALQAINYPNVKFWNKDNWTEFKLSKQAEPEEVADLPEPLQGNTQASQGINVAMRYVEDQHGNIVDGFLAAMMQSLAWAIWVELGISGAAPLTWGQADAETKKGYYQAMAAGFFELRLCDSNWKVEQIATENYSGWFSRWCSYIQVRPLLLEGKRVHNESKKAGAVKRLRVKAPVSNILLFPKHTQTCIGHRVSASC